jgi:hypothetical protein
VKIGITGHQYLENTCGWEWVRVEMDDLLTKVPGPLIGITCLAVGTDSLFAELVLQHRGTVEAVLPFPEYEHEFQIHERGKYQELLATASAITVLERKQSNQHSYLEAGKLVVDIAELLLAVWDGKPAKGLGGTADIVEYALRERRDIICLDPITRSVTILGSLP